MKWLKEIFSDAKTVLTAPLTNIICIAGIGIIALSFFEYSDKTGIATSGQIHVGCAVAGFLLLLTGIALLLFLSKCRKINRVNYNKGVEIRRGSLTVKIQTGEVQSVALSSRNTAIVLPANTTFVDDCVTDKRTAMGAFFLERFPEKISSLPELLASTLASNGLLADSSGQYDAGTAVVLPDEFSKPAKVVITASTIRTSGTGITSSPQIICSCVDSILRCTADQRVDTVFIPILGSGHGGVDRDTAVLFLVLALFHYSKKHHHIKLAQVVVHPKDVDVLNQSEELTQYLSLSRR